MLNRNQSDKCYSALLTPPTKYYTVLLNSFPSDQYVIPLLLLGALTSPWSLLLWVDGEKTWKKWCINVQRLSLAAILARWWQPVASVGAQILLYRTACMASRRRIAMAIKTARECGTFFNCCFVCCHPGSRRGNTKWILAQWSCPGASGIAMDMPHWVLYVASHCASARLLKWVPTEVLFCCIIYFGINDNSVTNDHVMVH